MVFALHGESLDGWAATQNTVAGNADALGCMVAALADRCLAALNALITDAITPEEPALQPRAAAFPAMCVSGDWAFTDLTGLAYRDDAVSLHIL